MAAGSVAGKLALVTGAGSGLGRATCQVLAREGATVVAADINHDSAKETLANIKTAKNDHLALEMNVVKSDSVKKVLEETMKRYQRPPTIVVNSAGITRDNWQLKMTEKEFDDVIEVNLKGTFLVTQAFSQAMIEAKVASGSIVNLSSIVARRGNKGHTNYAATKSGLLGMTKSAARELGRYNIRVNAVLPGFIKTPMFMVITEEIRARYIRQIPLGRLGEPSEVAEVIEFLSSDRSSYLTGAEIDISGGHWP